MITEHRTRIDAPPTAVWRALTDVTEMAAWMADASTELVVETDWTVGAQIRMRGRLHGPFENTGTVVAVEPLQRLAWTHLNSQSRLADRPEHHATIDVRLAADDDGTDVTVTIAGYADRMVGRHLDFYWGVAVEQLRRHVLGTLDRRVDTQVERTEGPPDGRRPGP